MGSQHRLQSSPRRPPHGLAALALWCCGACQPALVPCRSSGHCSSGTECLANRCVTAGLAAPVAQSAARIVLEPAQIAVVREGAPEGESSALPPTVTFGGAGSREQLLVRFEPAWATLEVEAAFLVLTAAPDAPPSSEDIAVTVACVQRPWPNGTLRESPGAGAPTSAGIARTRPPSDLRVDVTALLARPTQALEHGLRVESRARADFGSTYLTGSDGPAPRLEVYGQPSAR